MSDAKFEWDPAKNRSNFAKHGISFEMASAAFDDPLAVTEFEGWENGEERYRLLGLVEGVLILFVAFCHRGADPGQETFRIISARRATAAERRVYEDETGHYR